MYTISIKFAELRIEDQKKIHNLIDQFVVLSHGKLIESIINRNGIIVYIQTNKPLNNNEILQILQNHAWHHAMEWGSIIKSSTVIESIYICYNDVVLKGKIDIIPLSSKIEVHYFHNLKGKIKSQLAPYIENQDFITNIAPYINNTFIDKFCEHYSQIYTDANVYKIQHTKHNIPISIWSKFANETEYMFIPLSNQNLLTVLTCEKKTLIGKEALIADIENMILRDLHNYKNINRETMMYAQNYQYIEYIENMKKYINLFKNYFNINTIHENYLYYYFDDNYCELVQQYNDLKGEITKLIYPNDANIIDAIINLNINYNSEISCIIFAICYDKILWAKNNNYLPTGRGDQYGIKKYIKILVELLTHYNISPIKLEFSDLIINYIKLHFKNRQILKDEYLYYDLNLSIYDIKTIKRIKGIKIDTIIQAQNQVNEFEFTLLNALNKLENMHIILNNTNEYLNLNIIKDNMHSMYIIKQVQNYLDEYLI